MMAVTEEARAARDARLDELHERLTGAVETLVSEQDWARALAFAARFRSRSTGRVGVSEPRECFSSGLPVGGVVRPGAAGVRADADDGEWSQSEDAGEHRGRDLSGELLRSRQAQLSRLDAESSAQPVRENVLRDVGAGVVAGEQPSGRELLGVSGAAAIRSAGSMVLSVVSRRAICHRCSAPIGVTGFPT
jgi:hypothetical protein